MHLEASSDSVLAYIEYTAYTLEKLRSDRPDGQSQFFMTRAVKLNDARKVAETPTLASHGFELRKHRIELSSTDFFNQNIVQEAYYQSVCDLVASATGAKEVKAFHHSIRGKNGISFAKVAHCDYTPHFADQIITMSSQSDFKGRMAIYNVWRNINPSQPILNHHLAICDPTSVVSPDDFIPHIHVKDNGELADNYHLSPKNSRWHRWFYYPDMTGDEAIIFIQYDSDPFASARYVFHASATIQDLETIDHDRESIEVRLVAFFPADREQQNTLPDFTIPMAIRVDACVAQVKSDLMQVQIWDRKGKEWLRSMVASDRLEELLSEYINHHRQNGLRGDFKDLTEAQVHQAKSILINDQIFLVKFLKLVEYLEDSPTEVLPVPKKPN
jgi:hypothetical protein